MQVDAWSSVLMMNPGRHVFNAYAVLQCGSNFSKIKVQQHYGAQRTLAYGADWCHRADQSPLVATCSFYDKLVHLWQPDLPDIAL